MPLSGRPGAHSEPNIIDSMGLHLPQQRPCGPKCPVTLGRAAAVILAKRNAPFYWCKINDLHIGVDAGRAGGHHSPPPGAAHLPRRTASNARAPSDDFLFGQKILCSRNQNSLFPDGTGKWLQAIEFAWRPAPKTAPQGPHRTKFPKIRCYFPSSQGMRGSGRIKLSTPPSHPDD